jgi:hypothetical protein
MQARFSWPGRLIWLLVLMAPLSVAATSAGKRIVDEAVDASDADTMRLELRFEMPVNYLWHFPHTPKDEFLIAIQPIQVQMLSDYDADIREHIRIPPQMTNIITDLYYDGTEADDMEAEGTKEKSDPTYTQHKLEQRYTRSRFIVLRTNRKVAINVKQAVGGRKLIIEFSSIAPEPATECEGTSKPKKDSK